MFFSSFCVACCFLCFVDFVEDFVMKLFCCFDLLIVSQIFMLISLCVLFCYCIVEGIYAYELGCALT